MKILSELPEEQRSLLEAAIKNGELDSANLSPSLRYYLLYIFVYKTFFILIFCLLTIIKQIFTMKKINIYFLILFFLAICWSKAD